ncbi:hypothetical protein F5877DRAFT_71641 [Lentinula edodes]|nr:hypothetical protein F5877DRAFT_71641 [Lentinula edodes]
MLFKFAAPTMLIAVLLHTFVGTVAGTPQGPIIISCRGPNDHSALPAIFAATTQELGYTRVVFGFSLNIHGLLQYEDSIILRWRMRKKIRETLSSCFEAKKDALDRHLFKTTGCDKSVIAILVDPQTLILLGRSSVDSANMAKYEGLGPGKSKEVLAGKVTFSALMVPVELPIPVSLLFSIFLLLPPVQRLRFPPPRLTPTHNPASSRFALLLHSLPSHSKPSFSYGPKTLPRADFDSLTLCKSVAPLLEESGGAASTAPNTSTRVKMCKIKKRKSKKVLQRKSDDLRVISSSLPIKLSFSVFSRHLSEVYSSIKISFLIDSTAPLNALNLMEGTTGNQSRPTSCPALVAETSTKGSIVFIDAPFSMASSSTGTSGNAQARPSGASGTSVIGSDGITMNDGHKPVQPSATAFVRTRLSSVAGCLYQLLRELQVRGLSSPYSEESQEVIFFILLPIYVGNFDIDRRNPFKSLKKNRSNLFVQNTAILFASVKVSHRAWVIQARRQEKGRFEDRRACVAPAIVCRRFVVRVTPNCYHRSQIRVILKFSTHKHSGGLIRLSRSSIIVFDIAAKS